MIHCKKYIIPLVFIGLLPLKAWAMAPVVDDSDNFAMLDGQQQVAQAPVAHPKYDNYQEESSGGQALAKEEPSSAQGTSINNNATLIDKVQALQQEIQELRGQLEIQAHELKILKEQQVAFYKDLDARLGSTSAKPVQEHPPMDATLSALNTAKTPPSAPVKIEPTATKTLPPPPAPSTVSRANPADEQISYLAAYQLVKERRFDDAMSSMTSFVKKYPQGGYTSNAQYWLGELYLVKKDYSKAIEHFELVLHQFPSSSKAEASLLKTGYAYAALGDNKTAKVRFQQVVQNYPGTTTAGLASSRLEQLN